MVPENLLIFIFRLFTEMCQHQQRRQQQLGNWSMDNGNWHFIGANGQNVNIY
jgi:hypothetical protein